MSEGQVDHELRSHMAFYVGALLGTTMKVSDPETKKQLQEIAVRIAELFKIDHPFVVALSAELKISSNFL